MDDVVVLVLRLEVGNFERPHSVERQRQCLISMAHAVLVLQILTDLSQGAEHPGSIESLTLTMFAVIHHLGGLSALVRLRTGRAPRKIARTGRGVQPLEETCLTSGRVILVVVIHPSVRTR